MPATAGSGIIVEARVFENRLVCREHYRLTVRVASWPAASPGQFVHLRPATSGHHAPRDGGGRDDGGRGSSTLSVSLVSPSTSTSGPTVPMLRRAFSVARRAEVAGEIELDVMYRVVGKGTRWMATLSANDTVDILGPLGQPFPFSDQKPDAWLVAGGVGLPPLIWLAEALHRAGKRAIAFCGAQTADLLALSLDARTRPSTDAQRAVQCAAEFMGSATPVIISTDDGSLGFPGHVGSALSAYAKANPPSAADLVVYTCGPERMMRFVADFCTERSIECHVCMERTMACGMGTCQSCVVEVHDDSDPEGWRYALCCTEGPVFDARDVIWEPTAQRIPGCRGT